MHVKVFSLFELIFSQIVSIVTLIKTTFLKNILEILYLYKLTRMFIDFIYMT